MSSLLETDAIVLHAFDYLESSRILRLLTREAGVQSVIAKGARRARGPSRMTLDLFVEGAARVYLKPGRDLQTLGGFDLVRTRPGLAMALDRFLAASALAEVALRGIGDDPSPEAYAAVAQGLDRIAEAPHAAAAAAGLAAGWRLVASIGLAPAVERCASCDALLGDRHLAFSAGAGGLLCPGCGALRGGRRLPVAAVAHLRTWLSDDEETPSDVVPEPAGEPTDPPMVRAHQRLLREYLAHHVGDQRPWRAFDAWEHADWTEPAASPPPPGGGRIDGEGGFAAG